MLTGLKHTLALPLFMEIRLELVDMILHYHIKNKIWSYVYSKHFLFREKVLTLVKEKIEE